MREELTKVEAPLSPSSTICAMIIQNGILNLSISNHNKDMESISGKKIIYCPQKKEFAHSFSLSTTSNHPFIMKIKISVFHCKVSPRKLFLMPKHQTSKKILQDDPTLPVKIRETVRANRMHKIIQYEKTD